MEETAVIGVWILAISAFIAVLAKWFMSEKENDYITRQDYTFRDFYTRKHKR